MSIVVILTTSSRLLSRVRRRGRLVAPRLIATALLVALAGRSSRELWRFTMMASIASIAIIDGIDRTIAIGDGVDACCRLSRLCLVPTLASC
jgi:hypothetical protein